MESPEEAMAGPGSVTNWLLQLRQGDEDAAQALWQRYFVRLVGLARNRLRGGPRAAADEEDVALSAFDSFCRSAEDSRFPSVLDRDGLWRLLVLITARKAGRLRRHEHALKRGAGQVVRETDLLAGEEGGGLAEVVGSEPTPEFALEVAEECRRLLEVLAKEDLRAIALGKLEGYSNDELGQRLNTASRTIERKLSKIRQRWLEEVEP
jgi:DNA-directed RNA polymerase specialized sigma24 family protein